MWGIWWGSRCGDDQVLSRSIHGDGQVLSRPIHGDDQVLSRSIHGDGQVLSRPIHGDDQVLSRPIDALQHKRHPSPLAVFDKLDLGSERPCRTPDFIH